MFDGITGEKRWNVTFLDYASQPAKDNEYGKLSLMIYIYHLLNPRSSAIASYDRGTLFRICIVFKTVLQTL